jgi:hypothetical protein
MAEKRKSGDPGVLLAKHKIFNKLCTGHRRSYQNPHFGIRADDLRKELSIPEDIFAIALDAFINTENQVAVEIFQREGERYFRLGQSARDNCNDWTTNEIYHSASKTVPIKTPTVNYSRVLLEPAKTRMQHPNRAVRR